MKKLISIVIYFSFTFCAVAHASIIPLLDSSDWMLKLAGSNFLKEDFSGDAVSFTADSTNNTVGLLSIDVNGGVGDPGPTGLTGTGFFQSEVDSSGSDALSIKFSFAETYGFALSGLQNDSKSKPSALSLDEIAISVGSDTWVLSDLVGELSADIPFLGFVSDELITSFTLFHAGLITDVTRTSEEFYIDGFLLASSSVEVAEPPILIIFMFGLLGIWLVPEVKRNWVGLP